MTWRVRQSEFQDLETLIYSYLQTHCAELTGLHLSGESLENQLNKYRDGLVDVHPLALQDDHLQQFGCVTLRVLARVSLQHGLAHVVHRHHVVRAGEEGRGVHGDVVVQGGHHVGEIVEAVTLEHGVHHLQHLPHVGADPLAGQITGETHGLFVELHDAVGEDVVDGLQDDGLQGSVDLGSLLHHSQNGLHGV